jgi:hypothetical protein
MFDLNLAGLDRTIAVSTLMAILIAFGYAHRIALLIADRRVPHEVERRKKAARRLADRRARINPMIWTVLTLSTLAGACAETQTGPTTVAPVTVTASSSERVTTLSLRDQPPVSTDDSCPSAEIGEFKMNDLGPAPARVLPQGLRPTNLDTIRGYVIQFARRNDERGINGDFGVKAEPTQTEFIELLDWQPLRTLFSAGSWVARGKHLCTGGGEGKWTQASFSVDDAPQGKARPSEACATYRDACGL